ncbi:MAG: aldo/keto reductase [Thermoplasmata archaeon]|nr:aldo/keto reductase [Thermoplasmata archaeon]
MGERRIPGISRPISPLTLGFRAPRTAAALDRVRGEWTALLSIAQREGVLCWNASSAGDASAVVEELLGGAHGPPSTNVMFSVGVPGEVLRPRTESSTLVGSLDEWIAGVRKRLRGRAPDLAFIPGAEFTSEAAAPIVTALESLRDRGALGGWGVRLGPGPDGAQLAQRAVDAGTRVLAVPWNLIDPSPGTEVLAVAHASSVAVVATNPFADGLLDGSRLRASPIGGDPAGGPPRPWDARRMRDEFAPVLRVGFLTEGGRRTLPEAALAYARAPPEVVSVEVTPTDPGELAVCVQASRGPEMSADELVSIRRAIRAPGSASGQRRPGGPRTPG